MSRNAPNTRNRGIAAIADQIRACAKRGMLQIQKKFVPPTAGAACSYAHAASFRRLSSKSQPACHTVRYKPAPTRIRPYARRKQPSMKGIPIICWSGISPSVRRPDSDVLVVSAMCCARSALVTDRTNTATPTEMSAPFGSFRTAIRKTDDSA